MRRVSIGSPRDKNGIFSGSNRRSSLPGQMSINRLQPSNGATTLEKELLTRNGPLPRIRRINDRDIGSPTASNSSYGSSPVYSPTSKKNIPIIHGSNSPASSPRRYPTHQPQFSGLGILPSVRLNKPTRAVLSEQNSTMLNNSVTVKVAPPDVLKAPIPVFVQVSSKKAEAPSTTNSCDAESVLSALREKRKRNLGEDEECVPTSPDSKQVTKRRRQVEERDTNGDHIPAQDGGVVGPAKLTNKRPASEDKDLNDESQKRLKPERKRAVGVKNGLEASFSSSKRWIEKSRDLLNRSRDSSLSRSHRSFSAEPCMFSRQTSRNTSQSNTPRHSITLEEDVVMTSEVNLSNTSTPIPGTSGRTTPLTDGDHSDSLSTPIMATPKNKPLVLKEGSTKRRLMPASSSSDDYARVPRLMYQLTSEDFEKDRNSDIDRVKQLMNDVDEEYNKQKEKKKSVLKSDKLDTKKEVPTVETEPVMASSKPVTAGFALSTSKPVGTIAPVSTATGSIASSSQLVNSTITPLVKATTSSSSNLGITPIATTASAQSNALTIGTTPGLSSAAPASLTTGVLTSTSQQGSSLKTLLNEKNDAVLSTSQAVASTTIGSLQTVSTGTTVAATSSSASSGIQFKPVFGAQTSSSTAPATTLTSSVPTSTVGGFKFAGTIGVSTSTAGFSFGNAAATTAVASTTNTSNVTSLMTGSDGKAPAASSGLTFGQSVAPTAALTTATNSSFSFGKPTNSATSTAPGIGFNFTGGNNSSANTLVASTSNSSGNGSLQMGISQNTISSTTDSALNLSKPKVNDSQPGGGIFNFGQKVESTPKTNTTTFSFGGGTPSQVPSSVFSVNTSTQQPQNSSLSAAPFGMATQPSSSASTAMFGGASSNTSQPQTGVGFQFGNTTKAPVATSQPPTNQGLFSFGAQNKTEVSKPGATLAFGSPSVTQQASNTPTFGQQSNSVSRGFGAATKNTTGGFAPTFGATTAPQQTSYTASGFGATFGSTSTSQQQTNTASGFGATPQQASPFNFGAKAPSSAPAPTFGATSTPQQNGFAGGNVPQTANQSKGFNFAPSAGGNASFSFGGQAASPVQFGSPGAAPSPSFGTPSGGSNLFSMGSAGTAPRQRTVKTAQRRRPKR